MVIGKGDNPAELGIKFKVDKMFCLPDSGPLKAFADISINDSIVIRGVRVMEGKKGLFITMPREQGKDSKWYDQVVCKSAAVFDACTQEVLDHYNGTK